MVYLAQHQNVPEGDALQAEVKVWGYSLEDIPDAHLGECFRRAFAAKRDDYMLKAPAVLREWDAYREELVALATLNRDHLLMLPAPASTPITLKAFRARHNLPADWELGQPYPPESDLYGVPAERPGKVWVEEPVPYDPRWYRRTKKPWELYPTQDRPQRSMVRGVEFVWWVDACVGQACPGYILEHKGPGGVWLEQRPCPDHGWKLKGQPVEPMPVPAYVPRADERTAPAIMPEEDAYIRARVTQRAEQASSVRVDVAELLFEVEPADDYDDIPF